MAFLRKTCREKEKSLEIILISSDFCGPSVEIRTQGLLNPIQARYQTSPHPDLLFCCASQRQEIYYHSPKENARGIFQIFYFSFFGPLRPAFPGSAALYIRILLRIIALWNPACSMPKTVERAANTVRENRCVQNSLMPGNICATLYRSNRSKE